MRVPVERLSEVFVHDDVAHGRDPVQRGVEGRLHRDHRPSPQGRVHGQHRLRIRVLEPRPDRVLAEAREQRHHHRPDVLNGEEGGGHLRDHGHVEPDRIPRSEPEGTKAAREPADLPVKLPVGPLPNVASLSLPADGGAVLGGGPPVALDAVDDRVGPPPDAPSRPGEPLARVPDALPRNREPQVQEADRGVPEPLRILPAPCEERLVVVALDAHVPHEGHEVALFHLLGRRFPGESAHAGLLGGARRKFIGRGASIPFLITYEPHLLARSGRKWGQSGFSGAVRWGAPSRVRNGKPTLTPFSLRRRGIDRMIPARAPATAEDR